MKVKSCFHFRIRISFSVRSPSRIPTIKQERRSQRPCSCRRDEQLRIRAHVVCLLLPPACGSKIHGDGCKLLHPAARLDPRRKYTTQKTTMIQQTRRCSLRDWRRLRSGWLSGYDCCARSSRVLVLTLAYRVKTLSINSLYRSRLVSSSRIDIGNSYLLIASSLGKGGVFIHAPCLRL